jgi:hypothetical protein
MLFILGEEVPVLLAINRDIQAGSKALQKE